jgi:hypothetical protein
VLGKFMGSKDTTSVLDSKTGATIQVPANKGEIPPFLARPDKLADDVVYAAMPHRLAPMWPLNSPLDVTIVVSPSFVTVPLAKVPKDRIVLDEMGFMFGDFNEKRVIDTEFTVPSEVQHNGTLWAHLYIGLSGSKLDPSTAGYDTSRAFHAVRPLTQYIAQKKVVKVKNLLSSSNEEEKVG